MKCPLVTLKTDNFTIKMHGHRDSILPVPVEINFNSGNKTTTTQNYWHLSMGARGGTYNHTFHVNNIIICQAWGK